MKQLLKLIALAVCLSLVFSLASCADFGVGETGDKLSEYFSSVYVLSENGSKQYSISHFNSDIGLEDADVPVVVPHDEYSYIGFRVADGYTVSVSEFAFFAKTNSGNGELDLEFYVIDKMPTSLKDLNGNDIEISLPNSEASSDVDTDAKTDTESNVESDTEIGAETDTETNTETSENIREEDIFLSDNRFHRAKFSVGEKWNSVLLQFDGAQTVKGGEYVIVRIRNNCYSASGDESNEPIAFTFNYLLFYINSAHK